jgi:N-acetylmuramoyl-L-alanine amidase
MRTVAAGRSGPEGRVAEVTRATLMTVAVVVAMAIARPASVRAATITGAAIESQGDAVELRFALHGRGLGWHLSIHGQELWIDLDNVRIQLAPRPLEGQEVTPVAAVRAIYGGGASGRIVVEVKGRTDYVVGQSPRELILRVAPAGEVPNLAAPILTGMEHRRLVSPPPLEPYLPRVLGPSSESLTSVSRRTDGLPPAPIAQADSAAESATRERSVAPPAQMASRTAPGTLPPYAAGHQLVVIDAGHGGHDPGTEAAEDVAEKDLSLQIAIRVRDALAASGIDARLTRDSDTFLTLAERTQFASQSRRSLRVDSSEFESRCEHRRN